MRFLAAVLLISGLCSGQSHAQSAKDIQTALSNIGYNVGVADGKIGRKTYRGIEAFQRALGYLANQRLDDAQTRELIRLSNLATTRKDMLPVASDPRLPKRDPMSIFEHGGDVYPVLSYANGMHYVLARHGQVYNSANKYKAEFFQWNTAVQEWRWQQAMQSAQAVGDVYALAMLTLDKKGQGQPDFQSEVLPALRTIVDRAQIAKGKPYDVYRAFASFKYHFPNDSACGGDEVARQALPILKDALDLFQGSFANLPARGHIYRLAAECARGDEQLDLMKKRLAFAEDLGPQFVAIAARSMARMALERGDNDLAKTAFALMHDGIIASVPDGYSAVTNAGSVSGLFELITMYDLGLKDEVAEAFEHLVEIFRQVPPNDFFGTTAQRGNSLALLYSMLATKQFEPLRVLGNHLTGNSDPWYAMNIGALELLDAGEDRKVAEIASEFAHKIAEQGGLRAAAMMSTTAAEAWIRLGALRRAESVLDNAVLWSSQAGTYAELEGDIVSLRAQLDLGKAEAAGPGEALALALGTFIDAACEGSVPGKPNPIAPDVDYAALGENPAMRRALIRADILGQMEKCSSSRMVLPNFARLYCFLAGSEQRDELAQSFLKRELIPTRYPMSSSFAPACAFGLADAGRSEIFRDMRDRVRNMKKSDLYYLAASGDAEKAQIAREITARYSPDSSGGWDIDLEPFLAQMPASERLALIDGFRTTYIVVNSGASTTSQEIEYMNYLAFQDATAWLRLGLPDIAEVLFAVDDTVLINELPASREGWADEVLANQRMLKLVEAHARVAIARKDFDRARDILEPLVTHMLDLLLETGQALPSTIEQFSNRGRIAFELWLSLPNAIEQDSRTTFLVQQALSIAGSSANLSALDHRLSSSNPELARAYQDARRNLRILQSKSGQNRDQGALQAAVEQTAEMEAQLGGVLDARSGGAFGVVLEETTVADRLNGRDRGVLIASQLEDSLLLSWVDQSGPQHTRIYETRSHIEARIARFRDSITSSTAAQDVFDASLAKALYQDLLGWITGPLPDDIRIVLNGSLVGLPFSALQTENGVWLGSQHRLRISPSVAWALQENASGEDAALPFLGIGAPLFGSVEEIGVSLQALPETETEVRFLAAAYGGNPADDVLIGAAATEANLAEMNSSGALSNYRVISFATHGLLSDEAGKLNQAALALSMPEKASSFDDGFLSAEEIFNIKLNAKLVILSACNTGTPNAGEGLSDLASAFFFAGANSLMVSHWSVDSGGALEMMKEIALSEAKANADSAQNMRNAIIQLTETDGAFAHPRFWSGFFVLG